jgi:hypothetical protein
MTDDLEYLRLHMPKEEPPAARPQHLKYCRDLMGQRDWEEMVKGMPETWWNLFLVIKQGEDKFNGRPILRSDVNTLINELKKCAPKKRVDTHQRQHAYQEHKSQARKPADLEDGMYRRKADGEIFKVYHTVHGSNVQVAKQLRIIKPGIQRGPDWPSEPAKVEFEYIGRKPLYTLTASDRMTMDEAMEFGKLYGTCCICSRTLTNELSIHLGIGPVCGNREFGGEFTFLVDAAKVELGL